MTQPTIFWQIFKSLLCLFFVLISLGGLAYCVSFAREIIEDKDYPLLVAPIIGSLGFILIILFIIGDYFNL